MSTFLPRDRKGNVGIVIIHHKIIIFENNIRRKIQTMITTNTAEESTLQIKLADELFSIPYTEVQKRLLVD